MGMRLDRVIWSCTSAFLTKKKNSWPNESVITNSHNFPLMQFFIWMLLHRAVKIYFLPWNPFYFDMTWRKGLPAWWWSDWLSKKTSRFPPFWFPFRPWVFFTKFMTLNVSITGMFQILQTMYFSGKKGCNKDDPLVGQKCPLKWWLPLNY